MPLLAIFSKTLLLIMCPSIWPSEETFINNYSNIYAVTYLEGLLAFKSLLKSPISSLISNNKQRSIKMLFIYWILIRKCLVNNKYTIG